MAIGNNVLNGQAQSRYSVVNESRRALERLADLCEHLLPQDVLQNVKNVDFVPSPTGDRVYFPCPLKEVETTAAIKALEGAVAAAIADLQDGRKPRTVSVDIDKIACFLMSTYLTTVDGLGKMDPDVKFKLIDTDLNQAQSILYRRLSANLYETKTPGEYYHIHGSLDATKTLQMLGLPAFQPNLTDYRKCIDTIEAAVKRFTAAELDTLNAKAGQAGIHAMRWEQFRQTPHGRLLATLPPVTVEPLETRTPPVPFPFVRGDGTGTPVRQCLEGIRVIELCRIIAGPTIGRLLAAHGAQVLKVTSPLLPDVPFFQVDVNTGKHTCALHLRRDDRGSVSAATVAADRARFEHLLASADVVIDGYRPGALDRLGFGTAYLQQLACRRGKGFVYVAEDCFGGSSSASSATKTSAYSTGDWSRRPGWQQIADCVTGVAHAQGRFMRPSEGDAAEPVVPPFPMSDYGTGALGCVAALLGLYRRATLGGSWEARTSLCQYDTFVLGLGPLPAHVQDRLRKTHDAAFFKLRHADSVDEVGARALRSVRRLHPHLFDSTAPTTTTTGTTAAGTVPPQDAELPQQQRQQQRQQHGIMASAYSPGYSAVVRWPREPIRIDGLRVGHSRPTRPNAFDPPSWDGWEVDEAVVATGSM